MNVKANPSNDNQDSVGRFGQAFGSGGRDRPADFAGIMRHAFFAVVAVALLLVLLRLLKMAFADSWREWQLFGRRRFQKRSGSGTEGIASLQDAAASQAGTAPSDSAEHSTRTRNGRTRTSATNRPKRRQRRSSKRPVDKILLAAEIFAVAFVLIAGISLWYTLEQLNGTYRVLQQSDPSVLPTVMAAAGPQTEASTPQQHDTLPPLYVAEPARPTPIPTSTPVMAFAQAQAQAPSPTPKPPSGLAQRIQIPAIKVDSFVFPDSGPSTLKMGVVQYGERTAPGAAGNIVLAAHNDIFGAVFRNLDQLAPGDTLVLYEDRQQYVYRVSKSMIVEPDATWVMDQTQDPTLTLISCYPFLIDSQRIVVVGELAESASDRNIGN